MGAIRRRLIKPSTIEFFRTARKIPGYRWRDAFHGYIYARFPYLYIGTGVGEHWLAKVAAPLLRLNARLSPKSLQVERAGSQPQQITAVKLTNTVADGYHGKVMPLETARRLVLVNEEVRLTELEKVIPYARARDIILKNPQQILALECPCRSARANPCLPLDVCLIIGEPFASFVAEHHPRRSRRITPEEAVEILRAEAQRGHVHHAFFKDAMLNRYYAICNCCSCCCGAMQAQRGGAPMLAASGYVCQVDEILCLGCGDCAATCPFGALTLGNSRASVDVQACMGCGVCVLRCPQGALSLRRAPEKGEPLEIVELMQLMASQ